MKTLFLTVVLVLIAVIGYNQTNPNKRYQQGYTKKSSGTYIQAHFKTETNNTNHDNFSTTPNQNIYSGQQGYKAKDYSNGAYNYRQGKIIQTGSRGGQYYINDKGNKTYVPKRK